MDQTYTCSGISSRDLIPIQNWSKYPFMKLPGTDEVLEEINKLLAEPVDKSDTDTNSLTAIADNIYKQIAERAVETMYKFVIAASSDKDLMEMYIRGLEYVKKGKPVEEKTEVATETSWNAWS